eukprot:gene3293-2275_t
MRFVVDLLVLCPVALATASADSFYEEGCSFQIVVVLACTPGFGLIVQSFFGPLNCMGELYARYCLGILRFHCLSVAVGGCVMNFDEEGYIDWLDIYVHWGLFDVWLYRDFLVASLGAYYVPNVLYLFIWHYLVSGWLLQVYRPSTCGFMFFGVIVSLWYFNFWFSTDFIVLLLLHSDCWGGEMIVLYFGIIDFLINGLVGILFSIWNACFKLLGGGMGYLMLRGFIRFAIAELRWIGSCGFVAFVFAERLVLDDVYLYCYNLLLVLIVVMAMLL